MQLFIVLSLAALALTAQACQENAHYNSCGSACPLTCENYRDPPKACVLMCVEGCHCDDGYVLAKDGRCLLPDDCPATSNDGCGENQEFLTCGSACPLTCDNYEDRPIACTLQCVMGCHCKPGYVKANDGSCILPKQCPKKQSSINVWGSSPRCNKPLETGNCMAYFHRYGFNTQTGKCEKFVYGGCGGNDNNFNTLEECRSTCLSEAQLRRPDCDMEADAGLCQAYLKRFYYADGQCKEFVYGGCGGNRNNFKTEEECYNKCGALAAPTACTMEKAVGPCRAAFPRWYFNQQTNQCEEFIYGGCQGNSNNFNDQEDCEAVCLGKFSE